jgi:hypothetical protein
VLLTHRRGKFQSEIASVLIVGQYATPQGFLLNQQRLVTGVVAVLVVLQIDSQDGAEVSVEVVGSDPRHHAMATGNIKHDSEAFSVKH